MPYSLASPTITPAEQVFAALGDDELLVDLLAFVAEPIGAAARRIAVRVADAGDVDAHQLELGAHVGAREFGRVAEQLFRDSARHLVAGRDEAEQLALPQRAFADRVDVRIAGAARVVDCDAAACAEFEAARAREIVARTDARGEHDHVGVEMAAVGELHAVRARFAVDDRRRILLRVHRDAEFFDPAAQYAAATVVDLHRHQARSEFDHVRLQAHVAQRLRAFKAEQATADDGARFRAGAAFAHRFEIVDGSIHEAVAALAARHRRHERIGAGREHEAVVRQRFAVRDRHRARVAVDRDGSRVQLQLHAVALEKAGLDQRQVIGGLAREELGQMHAIVGRSRFFAQHRDVEIGRGLLRQAFDQLVADHPVADNDDFHERAVLWCLAKAVAEIKTASREPSRGLNPGDAVVLFGAAERVRLCCMRDEPTLVRWQRLSQRLCQFG
ncbi:hypothetical protein OKW43_004617 [Paraburkholderia sp. WC7.3g]